LSVYTAVDSAALQQFLQNYAIGDPVELKPILGGIENSNYRLTTSLGRYVLTLVERARADDLPFLLGLPQWLAAAGLPAVCPVADRQGELFSRLCDRPAVIMGWVEGESVLQPGASELAQIGDLLARAHLAARDFPLHKRDDHGLQWLAERAAEVISALPGESATQLKRALSAQQQLKGVELPAGAVHADLFRDNVLFQGGTLSGVLDFYHGCCEPWLYDLAIVVNDWCVDDFGQLVPDRVKSVLGAYAAVRPFTTAERSAWQLSLCRAALRFWISRLVDQLAPKSGELTFRKDPEPMRRILALRTVGFVPLSST
jgi:homoserine kinase type II